ncbi:MAG: glycosyltransferase family 39 protein [Bryobacteraceae bacterium]
MPQAAYIVFGWLFTAAVSMAAGRMMLWRMGIALTRTEAAAFAFLLGSAVVSQVTFVLAASQLLYKGVLLGAGVAILGLRRWIGGGAPEEAEFDAGPRWARVAAGALAIPFLVLYLSNAMAPETSPDGATYHLGLVARYYRERGFTAITTNFYASLSQGMEMLFLFAWPFGRHSAGALVHLNFLAALAALVVCYGRRFGFPVAGLAAALAVFVTPVVGVDASSAYNDVAVAAVLFGLFYMVRLWDERRTSGSAAAVGVLAGFAYAVKYTAFLGAVYAGGYLLWRMWRKPREMARACALVGAMAAIWILPWMIKNAIIVGNPVSPFGNRIFRNPNVHVSFEEKYAAHMRNYGELESNWAIPLEVTVRGQRLNGLLGPAFLLAPIGLLALSMAEGRRVLLAAALFTLPYAANIGTRFLIPGLALWTLAMALVLSRWRPLVVVFVTAHAVSSWPDVLKRYAEPYAWALDRMVWRASLRIEPERQFLEEHWPPIQVARMIDELVPEGKRVLAWDGQPLSYLKRDVVVTHQSAYGERLERILWTPLIPELQPTRVLRFTLPGKPVRRVRARQSASGTVDQFLVSEMRLLRGGRELPRRSTWKLRAWPNIWDVRDAFDNNSVTRWASWERLRPGMFVEVELPSPTVVDAVVLEMPDEQTEARPELEWEDAEGRLTAIGGYAEHTGPPPLGMRQDAMYAVKAAGVDYLLVFVEGFGFADFNGKQQQWGIRHLSERMGYHLYAIR